MLRQETLRLREALPLTLRHEKSAAIAKLVLGLPGRAQAQTIFTYVNFRSEVETTELIAAWLAVGKRVGVPLTLTTAARLVIYQITNPEQDLRPGYCQIPEPDPRRLLPVNPADIEVIILPGSVFDTGGGRLGYGGGYYDRFISQEAPHAIRIGLAFALQVTTADLPLLAHDQRIHTLVTEEGVLHFG
jgi:5-formyltetrahydrofolate cyclo-ligase